jgi:anti-sigma regulatory factor (Ser/Thr protein kinase)
MSFSVSHVPRTNEIPLERIRANLCYSHTKCFIQSAVSRTFSFRVFNEPNALAKLRNELDDTVLKQLPDTFSRALILLIADELVSNLVKYGFTGAEGERLELQIELTDNELNIDWRDNGRPFNPLAQPKPVSLTEDLASREIGGLGVYLVLNMVDESRYDWTPPWNCLSFRIRNRAK